MKAKKRIKKCTFILATFAFELQSSNVHDSQLLNRRDDLTPN